MDRGEIAENNFLSGLTCAQAVLLAFNDIIRADENTLRSISRGFGGGMGRLRETCGTVSGMVMAVGLLYPELNKNELYTVVQSLAGEFTEKNGSYTCRVLLTGHGIDASTTPHAEPRTPEYYKRRPCPKLCRDAAEILDAYVSAHPLKSRQ